MLFYTEYNAINRNFIIAATEKGLAYFSLKEDFLTLPDFAKKHQLEMRESREHLESYIKELDTYFSEEKTNGSFNFDLDMYGTDFQKEVWEALLSISYGETQSYQEIAQAIQRPKASRAVGTAVGRNPIMIVVPCHRVIHKSGSISGYRGGLGMKKELLKLENYLR